MMTGGAQVQATRGVPGYPSYAAAKAGMQGLARQMAVDYAQHGIRINCVSPCVAEQQAHPPLPPPPPLSRVGVRRGGIDTALNVNSQALEKDFLPKTERPLGQMEPESKEVSELQFDPQPRLFVSGKPIDVAFMNLFLASDESAHITGQNLLVDGGSSIAAGPVPGIR